MENNIYPGIEQNGIGQTNCVSEERDALFVNPHNSANASCHKVRFDVRGSALMLLATIACVFALGVAQKFFIPLVFAILIAYTLNPLVRTLERLKIPRAIATTMLFIGICLAVALNVDAMLEEFDAILVQVPVISRKISSQFIPSHLGEASLIQKVQIATNEIEKVTNQATGISPGVRKPVPDASPPFKLREWLLLGSMSVVGFIGQVTVVMFLVFFLLLSGNTFKKKFVRLTPSLTNKKVAVRLLGEINRSIQRYMFTLFITNSLVGVLSWLLFKMIGLENAGAWGIACGLFHVVPYIGPTLIALLTTAAAFIQFGTPSIALAVGGGSIIIAALVGTLMTTWLTGKISKMNPSAVFIALLFWGWLWGIWGLLLGIPIIVVTKVIAEHVEGMGGVAELLRE